MPDEIVVFAEPVVEDLGGAWIARLPTICLSGPVTRRRDWAVEELVVRFRAFIEHARYSGRLNDWLRDSGLTWGLSSDFPEAKSRFRG